MNLAPSTNQDSPSAWVPGSTVLDEFLVERPLGSGGFGRVELVRSRHSGHQYAVKRVRVNDPLAQGRFLTEAQRWIGIPPHDHIVACFFVRTIGQELAVFTEFVPGGSLADRISSGQLMEASPDLALYRIVDIAAQSAWGLDAAHAKGLLHLDVKPANILISEDSIAKITDFGLATTRSRSAQEIVQLEGILDYIAGEENDDATQEVIKSVLSGQLSTFRANETIEGQAEGSTSEYASLEQAEGRTVGRGADIWSWGLVVLEMFAGGRTWLSGTLAAPALERIARGGGAGLVGMPPFVHDLLRRCFKDDPADRPRSMQEVAAELTAGIERAGSQPLRRCAPARPSVSDDPHIYQRLLISGGRWEDPRGWLDFAYRSAGLDPEQAVRFWPPAGARESRSMALADLGAFLETRRVLEPVARGGSDELKFNLARLYAMIGMVQRRIGDESAAIENFRRAAEIDENLDGEDARVDLVITLDHLSIVLRQIGDASEAVRTADRAATIASELQKRPESHKLLGGVLQAKANAMSAGQEQLDLFRAAVAEYEAAGDESGVVKGLSAEAASLDYLGRGQEAELVWRRVDSMLDTLISSGHRDLQVTKALVLSNRATHAGRQPGGIEYASRAAALLTELVERDGMYELAGELGRMKFMIAQDHEKEGRPQEAINAYRAARLVFEDVVLRDGQNKLAPYLAQAFDHEATLVASLGDEEEAVHLAEGAVTMWTRIAQLDDVAATWQPQLADAHRKLAGLLRETGDLSGARHHAQEALTLLDHPDDQFNSAECVYLAVTHTEMAAVERAEGDPAAAVQRLQLALDVLGVSQEEASVEERATVLRRLGNALTDLEKFEDAVAAFDASIAQAESAQNVRTRAGTATEARHGRVNALLRFGAYERAVAAAEESLNRYTGLIAAGRADLRGEQARLQAALGQAFFLQGDLPGAIAAWQEAGPVLADSGGDEGAIASRVLASQVDELQSLLTTTPADVLASTDVLREEFASATRMSQSGNVQGASFLLENCLTTGLALRQIAASDGLLELCSQIGLAGGVTAMHSGRDAAAVRAFDAAGQCYRILYDRHQQAESVDRWCDTQATIASVHLLRRDQAGAQATVQRAEALLREIDPVGSVDRLARMRDTLANIGSLSPDPPATPTGDG